MNRKRLAVNMLTALSIVSMGAAPPAHADPLTPLSPNEVQYINQARQVYSVTHNPTAFRSDGELLTDGRYACDKRAAGFAGLGATFIDPVLSQLAFIYLCP